MLDLIIVLAFVVYAISVGLYSRKAASQNLQEYFLAGKTLPGWKAGFSMSATQFAADTPLLVAGLIATAGIFAVWRLWVYGLAFLMMAFIFAVGWRRGGILTDAELTETRYSGKLVLLLRVLKAVYYGTVINTIVLGMVLVAAIRIAEVFLPWHEWLPAGVYEPIAGFVANIGLQLGESVTGMPQDVATTNNLISILLILLFTTMYATTGGLRAVVATDVMQFFLAMIGTAIYAWFVVQEVGGFGALSDRVVELYGTEAASTMLSFSPPATTGEALLPFLVLVSLQWFFQMNSDGTGYLAQRSMACRTDQDARHAGVIFAWAQIFFRSLLWLAIGVGLLVLYPFTPEEASGEGFTAAREILFVTGINDLLPPGFRGLMLVALLAALASTVDTHLNWGASYWSNDVYDRVISQHFLKREPKEHELVVVARISNLVILTIALIIMANLGSIQTAWFISLLFGAGVGSVLVLRWLWERINLFSELAAMGASLITAPLLLYLLGTDPEQEWIRLGTMALVTTTAAVAITFFTPKTNDHVLVTFYERVKPFGWWSTTAAMAGDRASAPLEALWRRVRSMLLTGLSLFLMLLGVGRLMVSPPDASLLLTWGFIVVGLAVVPFWWRDLTLPQLEIDRSQKPEQDIELADLAVLHEPGGLVKALQQFAKHMKLVYGMAVTVHERDHHDVERGGQRGVLFDVLRDILLYAARHSRVPQMNITLTQADRKHVIVVEPESGTIDFVIQPKAGEREEDYDALLHIRERLYQVEGRINIEPDERAVTRMTLISPFGAMVHKKRKLDTRQ